MFEYNLWTAPDCAGTEYENGNRTWFYFSVSTPPNFAGKTLRYDVTVYISICIMQENFIVSGKSHLHVHVPDQNTLAVHW